MGLSEAVRNVLLDYFFDELYPTIYVALIKSDESEVSAPEYAPVETDSADWAAASGGIVTNSAKIIFPQPTSSWGAIQYVKIYDAASGGAELGVSELPAIVQVISVTPAPEFDIGNVKVKIT